MEGVDIGRKRMVRPVITKVTKTHFETDDGKKHPIPFELDKIPSVKEFQKLMDRWWEIFREEGLVLEDEQESS
jgi:hypothetical protein